MLVDLRKWLHAPFWGPGRQGNGVGMQSLTRGGGLVTLSPGNK